MRNFAKNFGKLTKKTQKLLKIALLAVPLVAAVAWLVAWPYTVLDATQRDNLLLTNSKFVPQV